MVIGSRRVGPGHPVFIIAELSANHGQDIERARQLVRAAATAGADAIKLQTYRPDTITIDCDNEFFRIQGTAWSGQTLFELYQQAFTPWEWHRELQELATTLGLEFFSSPFDETAVDFLESLQVPVYKVASFELVDIPLLKKIAGTGRPVIASTGMASREEIEEAVATLKRGGCPSLALLKCTSAYPAPAASMKLDLIPRLAADFDCLSGLSDHSLGITAPIAAVAVGSCIIEKHLTDSRRRGGPDAGFSLEPHEFQQMVKAVRECEAMLNRSGEQRSDYGPGGEEAGCRALRRSIFVVADVKAGETLTEQHLRSIRPGHGLPTRHLPDVLGRPAASDIPRGTPLSWKHVA